MKILVVCQHYWPEPFQLSDVCESLVKRGHTVHVITDVPNYPEGYIYEDYKKGKNREQEKDGVKKMVPCNNRAVTSLNPVPKSSENSGKPKQQKNRGNHQGKPAQAATA